MKNFLWAVVIILIIVAVIFGISGHLDWMLSILAGAIIFVVINKVPHVGRAGYVPSAVLGSELEKQQAQTISQNVQTKKIPNSSLVISAVLIIIAIILIILKQQFLGGAIIFFTVIGFGLYINNYLAKP